MQDEEDKRERMLNVSLGKAPLPRCGGMLAAASNLRTCKNSLC